MTLRDESVGSEKDQLVHSVIYKYRYCKIQLYAGKSEYLVLVDLGLFRVTINLMPNSTDNVSSADNQQERLIR